MKSASIDMNAQAPFPQKIPGEPVEDCRDFLRTGRCKYGASCKFNHPPYVQSGGGMKAPIDPSEPLFPIRPNEPVCQYYMKHGTCKFGQACKFHHPPQTAVPSGSSNLNRNTLVMGVSRPSDGGGGPVPQQILLSGDAVLQLLPQRPDEPNCIYFQRNGRCKYGASCRYHHPINFHQRKSIDNSRRQGISMQSIDRYHGHEGGSHIYGGSNVQFVASQPQMVQQQRGPTHVLVADAPITVMSIGNGAQFQNVQGSIHEGEYALPVGSGQLSTSGGQDRVSSSSSMGSSYETPVSGLDYLSTSLPTKPELWNRVPARTASTNSLSTYGDGSQVRSVGNRVVVHGGNENIRRHRAASFGSVGSASASEHSVMSMPQNLYHEGNGVMGWTNGASQAMCMPVHQESYATENAPPYEQNRRQHLQYGREGAFDGPIREEPVHGSHERQVQSARRLAPGRMHHERQTTDGGVDQGLSMMTSALLNMLDTPDDSNAAMKGLPSRISSSSTLNNALSPPQTPKSGHVNPPIEPSVLGEQMLPPSAPQPVVEPNLYSQDHSQVNGMNAPRQPITNGVQNRGAAFRNENGLNGNHPPYTPQRDSATYSHDRIPAWSPTWPRDNRQHPREAVMQTPQKHTTEDSNSLNPASSTTSNSGNIGLFLP